MRLCPVFILVVTSLTWGEVQLVQVVEPSENSALGYIKKYGIPRAEEIYKVEEELKGSRIVGGLPAGVGQYPFQAGLIGDINGLDGRTVCGGSLLSTSRIVTAAHCWNDGQLQVWRFTVVLGSTTLFTGGTRIESSAVITHPNWFPALVRNDIAVIYLPSSVTVSNLIAPVALPSGLEVDEDFVGEGAIAVGYGIIADSAVINPDQSLNHVRLNVISNSLCSYAFPFIIQSTHICTDGIGGASTCRGDSGGPLLATRNGRSILIGISSFVHALGCQSIMPAAFTRVTSYLDFINSHL